MQLSLVYGIQLAGRLIWHDDILWKETRFSPGSGFSDMTKKKEPK